MICMIFKHPRVAKFFITGSIFLLPTFALAQTTPQQTGPTAPTCTISATPTSVTTGGSITLKWSSTDADGGSISRVGTVGPSGQLNILLSAAGEVTFAGTFTGPGGTATCKTSVLVNAKTTGTSSTGSSYTSGSYSTGSYTTGSYTVDPNNFKTTATGITSSNTGGTSAISGNSTGVSSFLVPCGLTSADSPLGATSCTICSFGQLIQNLINFLIILAIPLSAGLFAWAGILRFTSYGNTSRLAKSKSIFKSVAIGLAIALSGYLIVQTLLNSLMNQNFFSNGWSWKTLNCSGDRPRQSKVSDIFKNLYVSPNATITTGGTGTGTSGGTGSGSSRGTSLCTTSNCNTDTIAAAALSTGQNLSGKTIEALSCIAQTESSGGATACSNTNACGVFQITNQNWNAYATSDCKSKGRSDATCNVQTALTMFSKSGYQPWTGTCNSAAGCGNVANGQQWNPAASTCVNTYDPNTSYRTN